MVDDHYDRLCNQIDSLQEKLETAEAKLAEARAKIEKLAGAEKMLARVTFLARERTKLQIRLAEDVVELHEARTKIKKIRAVPVTRGKTGAFVLEVKKILGDDEADSARGSGD